VSLARKRKNKQQPREGRRGDRPNVKMKKGEREMANSRILEKIVERIESSDRNVLLRKDFADLGSGSQVGRCLRKLTEEQKLVRVGLGIYAKTKVYDEPPFVGKIYMCQPLPDIAKEALQRLGVEVVPAQCDREYAEGRTTQVPTGRRLGIKGRKTSRRIGYKGVCVNYEYVS
jgi:hypothetical protein